LTAIVGGKLTAKAVLASKANARTKKDVFMTFAESFDPDDIPEGKEAATSTLRALLEDGALDRAHEYEVARVLELILNHVGTPMKDEIQLADTYHVPHSHSGCWNPYLRALRMPHLAKLWAAENLRWPWKRPLAPGWPVWTELPPATLPMIAKELASVKRADLDKLAPKTLSHHPDDARDVKATRDELWEGLTRLRGWIAKVPKGESLVLSMDGDQ
jgi:hypothetical protein